MAVYIVTWNLNSERSNYNEARRAFLQQLEKFDNISDSGLESVRFISTKSSASQIDELLRQKMDKNDRLVVSQMISGSYAGWLQKETWEWIDARA